MSDAQNENPKPLRFSQPLDPVATAKEKPELVYLPGLDNIPVRGAPDRVLTPEELRTYKPHWQIHFRVFDLEDEEQRADYERLGTAAASCEWVLVIKEIIPENVGNSGGWRIGVKWGELYYMPREHGVFLATDDPLGEK